MRLKCLHMVYKLARMNPRIVYIGSDVGPGTLDEFKHEMPDRFFMEGISEAHVLGMAAGLAKEGYIPYVNTIATFISRRAFEQAAVDLCLHNLPVRLIGNGGGLVYAPLGPTHQAIEDLAIMRTLPNMTAVAPTDADEMERFMLQTLEVPGPIYIRLAKGYDPIVSRPEDEFKIGKAILLREPGEVLIVANGVMVHRALTAAELLSEQGIKCGVLNMHTIKPLDHQALLSLASRVKLLVTLEEHTLIGGLGSAVVEALVDHANFSLPKIKRLGLPDKFSTQYGSQDGLLTHYGLNPEGVSETISTCLSTEEVYVN